MTPRPATCRRAAGVTFVSSRFGFEIADPLEPRALIARGVDRLHELDEWHNRQRRPLNILEVDDVVPGWKLPLAEIFED